MANQQLINKYKEALSNPYVRAALSTIAFFEGTDNPNKSKYQGYDIQYGYANLGLSPEQRMATYHPTPGKHSPAGRYQIVKKTHAGTLKKLKDNGLLEVFNLKETDWSPTMQDLMAISIIDECGELDNLLSGNAQNFLASKKIKGQWDSFPGTYHNGKKNNYKFEDYANIFNHRLTTDNNGYAPVDFTTPDGDTLQGYNFSTDLSAKKGTPMGDVATVPWLDQSENTLSAMPELVGMTANTNAERDNLLAAIGLNPKVYGSNRGQQFMRPRASDTYGQMYASTAVFNADPHIYNSENLQSLINKAIGSNLNSVQHGLAFQGSGLRPIMNVQDQNGNFHTLTENYDGPKDETYFTMYNQANRAHEELSKGPATAKTVEDYYSGQFKVNSADSPKLFGTRFDTYNDNIKNIMGMVKK